MIVYRISELLNLIQFDKSITIIKKIKINSNKTIYKLSGYSFCLPFPTLISNIISSMSKNIELISHYDIVPQLLLIPTCIRKFIKLKLLKSLILQYEKQIVYINSIIFKNYIKIKTYNVMNLNNNKYYIGSHIRMGDKCMTKDGMCFIDIKRIKMIIKLYNNICGNRNCTFIIASDSLLLLDYIKNYNKNAIIYKEGYKIIHSNGIDINRNNYSISFYDKLLGDINLLSMCNYLILSARSSFSLIILYNNKKTIHTLSNYIFYNDKINVYDPLKDEIKKNLKKCT